MPLPKYVLNPESVYQSILKTHEPPVIEIHAVPFPEHDAVELGVITIGGY